MRETDQLDYVQDGLARPASEEPQDVARGDASLNNNETSMLIQFDSLKRLVGTVHQERIEYKTFKKVKT
jgi:hypothetical protein